MTPAAGTPPEGAAASPPVAGGGPQPLTAGAVAVNTGIVGVPVATVVAYFLTTYWKPGGVPLPDWVAAAIGAGVAGAATYVYHIGSALAAKWLNAKLND